MKREKNSFLLLQIFAEEDGSGDREIISADAGREDEDHEDDIGERFEKLIRGEYADEFARRTQKIIDRRFKEVRTLEEKNRAHEEFEKSVSALLGAGNAGGGELIELLKRWVRVSPDEKEMAGQIAEAARMYPGFDHDREREDPLFERYLTMGLTLAEAYALTHREELLDDAAKRGALDAVRSIGSMPARAPQMTSGSGGREIRRSVSSLTPSEIRSIVERAARGEKIDLSDLGL